MTKKNVYLLMGISGAGKSTWVRNNVPDAAVSSADHFFMKAGKYDWEPSKLGQAHAASLSSYVKNLENPEITNIVVDNTNTKRKFLLPYVLEANLRGIPVTIVAILTDPHVAAARNTHGVPVETVMRMQSEIENTLKLGFPPSWDIKEIIKIKNA